MQNHEPRVGDIVAVVTGGYAHQETLRDAIAGAPALSVVRQMPYDVGIFELSDGSLHAASELHLIERPAESVEGEHPVVSDNTIASDTLHVSSAPEPEG